VKVESEETLARVVRKKITFAAERATGCRRICSSPRATRQGARRALPAPDDRDRKGEPAGVGGKKNLHYALELAERGYVTLAPDYPNFGGYKIDVYAKGYASATMKGIWNHARALDLLASLPEVDGARLGVVATRSAGTTRCSWPPSTSASRSPSAAAASTRF